MMALLSLVQLDFESERPKRAENEGEAERE